MNKDYNEQEQKERKDAAEEALTHGAPYLENNTRVLGDPMAQQYTSLIIKLDVALENERNALLIATELGERAEAAERERDALRHWLDSNTTFYDVDADFAVSDLCKQLRETYPTDKHGNSTASQAADAIAALCEQVAAKDRDVAAIRELMNVYNLGGWTDALAPMQRALAAEADNAALRNGLKLLEHKVITCGVAASHPDSSLTRTKKCYAETWNSPQAEQVRALRDRAERAEADNAALRQDAGRYRWLRVGRKGTYNKILIHAESALDAAIDAAMREGKE